MRKSIHSRGFTLLELLVGAAVGAVVLLGISLTFISQAQQYQAHASRRGVQANARQALSFMERHLRVAGYGVDPDRAIIAYDSFNAAANEVDEGEGYPDAFVVHWRDPVFQRRATALDANSITLDAPLQEEMRRGQILMVICAPGSGGAGDRVVDSTPPHVFVTVGDFVASGNTIKLDNTDPAAAPNSPQGAPGRLFHEQATPGFSHPCFNFNPYVVLIRRAAFYVALFDDDGDPATPERTPYLMLHEGLDNPSSTDPKGDTVIDANDAVPVAEGVEQLQVAYMLDTTGINPPKILGVSAPMGDDHNGENWEQIKPGANDLPTGWFFNPFKPNSPERMFSSADMATKRLDDHPANIRQVRLTVIARSSLPDPQIQGDNLLKKPDGTDFPVPANLSSGETPWRHLENLSVMTPAGDFAPTGGHYYRSILRQSVAPKNLSMTRQFAPVNPGGG